jgi:transketolase
MEHEIRKRHEGHDCIKLCTTIRRWIVEQSLASKVGHIGSCLSIVEIMAALWCGELRAAGTTDPDRDRFLLCKGHAALTLYCFMHWRGLIDAEKLATYCHDGSDLGGHPLHRLLGVELSTGSLGQGLSVACGIAYGLRLAKSPARVFAVMSDGECNEGQVWEAAAFAAHHHLTNLCVVVDYNRSQCLGKTSDILLLDLPRIWDAYGWHTVEVNGHSVEHLRSALQVDAPDGPKVIVAKTILGKGVSFMEDRCEWHYRNLSVEMAATALAELRIRED